MLAKKVIEQELKIVKLQKENKTLYKQNLVNKKNLEDYQKFKEEIQNIIPNIENDLYRLQDIDRLGIDEKEKIKHRNVIINNIIFTVSKIKWK